MLQQGSLPPLLCWAETQRQAAEWESLMVERRDSGELRWEAAGLGRLEASQLTAERAGRSARSTYLAT